MVEDWTGVIFGMGACILATVIIVVVMIVASNFARDCIARNESARLEELVKRYEALIANTTSTNTSVSSELTDVRGRVTEIERMLKEVG